MFKFATATLLASVHAQIYSQSEEEECSRRACQLNTPDGVAYDLTPLTHLVDKSGEINQYDYLEDLV